ncbi:MAG: ATP-binding protein [Burkholderiaceae bacterium]
MSPAPVVHPAPAERSPRPGLLPGPASLFWKLLIGFWLTLLVAGLLVGTAVGLYHKQRAQQAAAIELPLALGPRTELQVRAAAATLRHGGLAALQALLASEDGERGDALRVHAVDANGRELLGRPVPAEALAQARTQVASAARSGGPVRGVREIALADGQRWLLLVPAAESGIGPRSSRAGYRSGPPTPALGIAAGLLASLVFSAVLAAYLTRPIRHLRRAFADAADGRLDARVAPLMGRRRDEIAGLGQDFDQMAERLQRLIVSQRRLLHDVSHELRSPLARLQAAIGLARQDPSRSAAMLDRIERDTQRLDALVGELLTLARLEANARDTPRQTVDVGELLQEVADDARFEAQAAGRSLVLSAPTDDADTVIDEASPEWLQRAFENVIRNAIRHTAEDSAVEVELRTPGGDIEIQVADRGPGVPDELLEAIFEPFDRGRIGAGDSNGHGLGLAIARRAVAAHGGTIVAGNRAGGGLVMTLRLPQRPQPRQSS